MDLFIQPAAASFEKTAAEVALAEDPNQWATEVMQELYKQVPYLADFEPHVEMDKIDAERGYGFGHVEVMNKTEIQHGASVQGLDAAGVKTARIPIVIKDRRLQPFDLLITEDDKMLPLTESRLRQAIFRPSAFDITGRSPGDQSLVGQLYPPYRQNYGMGGGGGGMTMPKEGSVKEAVSREHIRGAIQAAKAAPTRLEQFGNKMWQEGSAHFRPSGAERHEHTRQKMLDAAEAAFERLEKNSSILSAILPSITEEDYNGFFERFQDPRLQASFVKNAYALGPSMKVLAEYNPIPVEKTASFIEEHLIPSVVQITKTTEGYTVKTASHVFWQPREKTWHRGEVVRTFGEKVAFDADTAGAVTMGGGQGMPSGPEEQSGPEADRFELIKDFGLYRVKDTEGRDLVGYVFPNLMDLDGTALPLALFTNGSQSALQGEIVGLKAGEGAALMEGHPRGKGAFYQVLPNGKAQATIPLTIRASLSAQPGAGVTLDAETFDGRPIQVMVSDVVSRVQSEGETMMVPAEMCWLPLDTSEEVDLVGSVDEADAQKTASVNHGRRVEIRCGGNDSFSLTGMPVEKVASDDKSFLSIDDAMFLLTGLGVHPSTAGVKLGRAMFAGAPVTVETFRDINQADDMRMEAIKTASKSLANIPNFRVDLVKEAAVIPDPVAVDTVLSLGFINPENMHQFVAYLPHLDEAQGKMCELLLAARLGLRDIPVSALEKAIHSTEEVVEGLKVVALQS